MIVFVPKQINMYFLHTNVTRVCNQGWMFANFGAELMNVCRYFNLINIIPFLHIVVPSFSHYDKYFDTGLTFKIEL